jgi:signal transduction histidine kinase
MAISVLVLGKSWGLLLGGLTAILGGAVIGFTRRQGVEHAEQMARMEVSMARTEVERARAEPLAERNHLAREIHDVAGP